MPKIYLAGPWTHRDAVRGIRDQFVKAGIEVGSRWLDKEYDNNSYDAALDKARLKQEATNDIEDVYNADGLVVYHSKISEGKSFEQGFYLGISEVKGNNNKIILIDPFDVGHNVFHNLDMVYTRVETVEQAIEEVKKWERKPTA